MAVKNAMPHRLTAIGAGLPGTFTAHGSPDKNDGKPSAGMLIPGNIKSAPPMTNRETSPPFNIKHGRSSGTFHSAKTAQRKSNPSQTSKQKKMKTQNIMSAQNKRISHYLEFHRSIL